MNLNTKTLEKLRELINEETEYRSGPKLVKFFNELGFNDEYGQGFPSRWMYTDARLVKINGTSDLDKCIKNLLAPFNFIGNFPKLDDHISDFNQYMAFDNWKVVRREREITFTKSDKIDFEEDKKSNEEDEFLKQEFLEISLDSLDLDTVITEVLRQRFDEIEKCLTAKASLAAIFLSGSTLEGILLGIASKHPMRFNQSKSSPKNDEGNVKKFHEWTLSNFINVAYDLGIIKEDVKRFSHSLRYFRNYIHPYEQISSNFNPDKHTALISWQVLRAAVFQLKNNKVA